MAIPKPRLYAPPTFTASDRAWEFSTDNFVTSILVCNFDTTVDFYLDPEAFAAAWQVLARAAITASGLGTPTNFSVTFDQETGKFTATWTGQAFYFRVPGGSATSLVAKATGFTPIAGSATTRTSTTVAFGYWFTSIPPIYDTGELYEAPGSVVQVSQSGKHKLVTEPILATRSLDFGFLDESTTKISGETTAALTYRSFETIWRYHGRRFRYWPDRATLGTNADYFLDQGTVERFAPQRMRSKPTLWSFSIGLRRYVT